MATGKAGPATTAFQKEMVEEVQMKAPEQLKIIEDLKQRLRVEANETRAD